MSSAFPMVIFALALAVQLDPATVGPPGGGGIRRGTLPGVDLAEGLAARGVATLRDVKRNCVAPLPASATLDDEVTNDALAAVALARTTPGVDASRIYQVNGKDFARWSSALADSPNATLKRYPRLNHLFLEGDGVSMPAEYQTPGRIPPQVFDDIATWVQAVSPGK